MIGSRWALPSVDGLLPSTDLRGCFDKINRHQNRLRNESLGCFSDSHLPGSPGGFSSAFAMSYNRIGFWLRYVCQTTSIDDQSWLDKFTYCRTSKDHTYRPPCFQSESRNLALRVFKLTIFSIKGHLVRVRSSKTL